MTFEIQQAIRLLTDLLRLKSADLAAGDRQLVDEVLDQILQAAFDDVKRLMVDWAQEVAERAERILEAQAQAERDVVAAEAQAARDVVQDELDAAQRQERHLAGVS